MWTLPTPDVDGVEDHLTKVLTGIKGKRTYVLSDEERTAIRAVYQAYDTMLGQPDPSLTSTVLDGCADHIRNGYSHVRKGGRLANLRSSLLNLTEVCPYCGFGEPTELDHYLPKCEFDELAIYPRNLIPSCSHCNRAKGTLVPSELCDKRFIHAYFQVLPDVKFMCAEAKIIDEALVVTFRIDAKKINVALANILQFQLDRLMLNDRYRTQINIFLSAQRTGMLLFKDAGFPARQMTKYLRLSAKSLANKHGSSDWRVALMDGLAANKKFCAEPENYV